MIQVETACKNDITINRKEVLRYLGYPYPYKDQEYMEFIENCICETEAKLNLKACYAYFPVTFGGDGQLDLGFATVISEKLCKNLSDCREMILFCATVGIEVDRLIQKYTRVSPARAAVIQAAGAAAIEDWCVLRCKRFANQNEGRYLKPRFSPGYGDLSLEVQKNIFRVLDCNRKIGVALGEQFFMTPTKSVTAMVGISEISGESVAGCKNCSNTECQFRRKKDGFSK